MTSKQDCDNKDEQSVTLDMSPKINRTKDQYFCHNVRRYLREYDENTGIHGLRYLTEKRSRFEKFVWSIILLCSLAGCIYMIYEVLYKYRNSPVVVSFATEDTPIYHIPFPAVTICPLSKFSPNQFNLTEIYEKLNKNEKVSEENLKDFYNLNMLCDNGVSTDMFSNDSVAEDFFQTFLKLSPPTKWICYMNGEEDDDCKRLFIPVLIDEGICYSFNTLGRDNIYKKNVFQYENFSFVNKENFFNIETGYSEKAKVKTYPKRAWMSGSDNSLIVIIGHEDDAVDYLCTDFLQGYRFLLHNPMDVPRLSQHSFNVPFDTAITVAVEPELITTSKEVQRFNPEIRQCYFSNERPLKYFKDYSQRNCLYECATNSTLASCGCVSFDMPRFNGTPICGISKKKCLEDAQNKLKVQELEAKISGTLKKTRKSCDCKASCTSLDYNAEMSSGRFYLDKYIKYHEDLPQTHWSAIQIYFKNEQFMPLERNELYGISDLISNLGGLLGLFTGFSLISLAEIIYFLSLRLFCNERMYGRWYGPSS